MRRECILTTDNLMKRGKTTVHGCYLCKKAAESCNHILLRCSMVYSTPTVVYDLLGINCVLARSVRMHFGLGRGGGDM